MANALWCGGTGDKLYYTSGEFTSTLKDSQDVSAADLEPSGVDYDGSNTLWAGDANDKLFEQSGLFTSIIKTSLSVSSKTVAATGVTDDGAGNTIYASGFSLVTFDSRLFWLSGRFTATVKNSFITDTPGYGSPDGVSYDGTDTPYCDADKIYKVSGLFTSILKDSQSTLTISATGGVGLAGNGTDTLWAQGTNSILYKLSGSYTDIVKTSLSVTAVDSALLDIATEDHGARLGASSNSGNITLPLLFMNNPQTIALPQFSIQGLGGATGNINLPILTVLGHRAPQAVFNLPILTVFGGFNPEADITFPSLQVTAHGRKDTNDVNITLPFSINVVAHEEGGEILLPILTIAAIGFANEANITLPIPTVQAQDHRGGDGSVTLPKLTLFTEVQQGSVENIDITLPMLTLNAFSGHPVALELPSLSFTIEGKNGFVGTFSKSLTRMTVNVKASQNIIGTSNISLPSPTFSNSLLTGVVSLAGGNRTLPIFTLNSQGFRGENGDVAITLPVLTLTTEGVLDPSGTVSQSLFMLTLDAYADVYINRIV